MSTVKVAGGLGKTRVTTYEYNYVASHTPQHLPDWRPLVLRVPVLSLFLIFTLAVIGGIEALARNLPSKDTRDSPLYNVTLPWERGATTGIGNEPSAVSASPTELRARRDDVHKSTLGETLTLDPATERAASTRAFPPMIVHSTEPTGQLGTADPEMPFLSPNVPASHYAAGRITFSDIYLATSGAFIVPSPPTHADEQTPVTIILPVTRSTVYAGQQTEFTTYAYASIPPTTMGQSDTGQQTDSSYSYVISSTFPSEVGSPAETAYAGQQNERTTAYLDSTTPSSTMGQAYAEQQTEFIYSQVDYTAVPSELSSAAETAYAGQETDFVITHLDTTPAPSGMSLPVPTAYAGSQTGFAMTYPDNSPSAPVMGIPTASTAVIGQQTDFSLSYSVTTPIPSSVGNAPLTAYAAQHTGFVTIYTAATTGLPTSSQAHVGQLSDLSISNSKGSRPTLPLIVTQISDYAGQQTEFIYSGLDATNVFTDDFLYLTSEYPAGLDPIPVPPATAISGSAGTRGYSDLAAAQGEAMTASTSQPKLITAPARLPVPSSALKTGTHQIAPLHTPAKLFTVINPSAPLVTHTLYVTAIFNSQNPYYNPALMPQRGERVAYRIMVTYPLWAFIVPVVVPVAIAVILRLFWTAIYQSFRRCEPFHLLSRSGGALGQESLMAYYLTTNLLSDLALAVRRRHWSPLLPVLGSALANMLPSLASELLLSNTKSCPRNLWSDNDNNPCSPELSIQRVVARALQAVLALSSGATILLMILMWTRKETGLNGDPTSVASVAALTHHPALLEELAALQGLTSSSAQWQCFKKARFTLAPYSSPDGAARYGMYPVGGPKIEVHEYGPLGSSKIRQSKRPKRRGYLKDIILALFALGLLAVIVAYYKDTSNSGFNRFFNSNEFGPRFLFASVGCLLAACCDDLYREVELKSVFSRLASKPRLARETLLVTRSTVPLGAIYPSIRTRDYLTAAVAFTALLMEFLVVALPGIPFSAGEVITQFQVSTLLSLGILSLTIITAICVTIWRSKYLPYLPVEPDTVAGVMYYIHQSQLVNLTEGLELDSSATLCKKLQDSESRWVYRRFPNACDDWTWMIDEDDATT